MKINTGPVCYGARRSDYGSFVIKESGNVTTVKLVHLSGYITCYSVWVAARSNWECAPYFNYNDRLMVVITDSQNKIILPQGNVPATLEYTLPGFTSKSPELIFKKFEPPMVVTAGQEYRIWYGHDLTDNTEGDNDGQACTDVYMYAIF